MTGHLSHGLKPYLHQHTNTLTQIPYIAIGTPCIYASTNTSHKRRSGGCVRLVFLFSVGGRGCGTVGEACEGGKNGVSPCRCPVLLACSWLSVVPPVPFFFGYFSRLHVFLYFLYLCSCVMLLSIYIFPPFCSLFYFSTTPISLLSDHELIVFGFGVP